MQNNMPQLQRLGCQYSNLTAEGVRAFQPALQANRTLKELDLRGCDIGDEGIRLLADALAGNRIMEVLDISGNDITSDGLDDITRIIESTQVKTLRFKAASSRLSVPLMIRSETVRFGSFERLPEVPRPRQLYQNYSNPV
jgi:Ran GTPase-activating protein (RanGAP) involved in mRNA processing and transport